MKRCDNLILSYLYLSSIVSLIIIFSSPIYAQDDIFENTSDFLVPPAIPNIEYSNMIEVVFTITDAQNMNISDVHADIEITNKKSGEKIRTLQYIKGNKLMLELHNGSYDITVGLDNINTSGFDYYSKKTFIAYSSHQEYFMFFPIGSVRGSVTYEDGSIATNANVKIECAGKYGEISETTTDNYGSFSKDYVPVGNCVIYAKKDGRVDKKQITVNHGEISVVDLAISKNYTITYIILIIILVFSIGAAVFYMRSSRQKNSVILDAEKNKNQAEDLSQPKNAEPDTTQLKIIQSNLTQQTNTGKQEIIGDAVNDIAKRSTRQEDILKTLNEKEKKVVEFLLSEDNSYQNKIVYSTGIAKTSMVRIIEGLEKKNIIKVELIGNTKKLKLTDWFLEK